MQRSKDDTLKNLKLLSKSAQNITSKQMPFTFGSCFMLRIEKEIRRKPSTICLFCPCFLVAEGTDSDRARFGVHTGRKLKVYHDYARAFAELSILRVSRYLLSVSHRVGVWLRRIRHQWREQQPRKLLVCFLGLSVSSSTSSSLSSNGGALIRCVVHKHRYR